ncbi:MAG TPA: hypothetical protein VII40_02615 [Xanthobacteraceae bacterium]
MSVDFIYTDASSYRAYLAGLHQREKLDIAIAKAVRAAVGAVAEIYGADRPLLREALRDFRYAPDAAREVMTVNLYYACAALDPVAGDVVRAFQSLFDDDAAQIAEPAHGGSARASEAEQLLARVRALGARQRFVEALRLVSAILVEYPAACARDRRFEWLRAALLAGIPGQPKSAAMVDLPAAERALLQIAQRAGGGCAEEAAAALVEAGRCAYADGRFADAKTHYGRALEHDPGAAEAHYQIARLARHAGRSRDSRVSLVAAFGLKFGYALRAASDPLFAGDVDLVHACVVAATRRATRAARDTLRQGLARLRFLARNSDRDFPAEGLDRFAPTRAELTGLAAAPAHATLRRALLQFAAAVAATRAPVARLAQDYCALLRANEDTIALRDVDARRPAADPGKVARWLTRATEASVAATLLAVVAGISDFAAAAPLPAWHATQSASALGLAVLVAILWLSMHTSFLRQPTRTFFQRIVTTAQAWSLARFARGRPRRIARNRRKLHQRIRRIERRLGIASE